MSIDNPISTYKTCFVPTCTSTTIKTPDKLFLHVPSKLEERKAWCEAVGREPDKTPEYNCYCCEDHFNLPEDMLNYHIFSLIGGKKRIRPGVVPYKNLNRLNEIDVINNNHFEDSLDDCTVRLKKQKLTEHSDENDSQQSPTNIIFENKINTPVLDIENSTCDLSDNLIDNFVNCCSDQNCFSTDPYSDINTSFTDLNNSLCDLPNSLCSNFSNNCNDTCYLLTDPECTIGKNIEEEECSVSKFIKYDKCVQTNITSLQCKNIQCNLSVEKHSISAQTCRTSYRSKIIQCNKYFNYTNKKLK